MEQQGTDYIPALRFRWLTNFYDPVVSLTTRESKFKSLLITFTDIQNGEAVLDIGCGTGTLALEVKNRAPAATVCGIDGDPEILEIAKRKALLLNTEITFQLALSYELPYEDELFDCCLSTLFFHHLTLENKKQTLLEMRRVLKIGGRCFVADWGKPTNTLMRFLFFQIQILDGFETTQHNVEGLLPTIMASSGFTNIQVMEEVPTMFGTMTLYSMRKEA